MPFTLSNDDESRLSPLQRAAIFVELDRVLVAHGRAP